MIDYTQILTRKYVDSLWTLNGDDYNGLTWVSDTPKPSKATLDGLWDEVELQIKTEAEAKETAKAALLAQLGITEEQAKLLLS
jgi:hypothetical protein